MACQFRQAIFRRRVLRVCAGISRSGKKGAMGRVVARRLSPYDSRLLIVARIRGRDLVRVTLSWRVRRVAGRELSWWEVGIRRSNSLLELFDLQGLLLHLVTPASSAVAPLVKRPCGRRTRPREPLLLFRSRSVGDVASGPFVARVVGVVARRVVVAGVADAQPLADFAGSDALLQLLEAQCAGLHPLSPPSPI